VAIVLAREGRRCGGGRRDGLPTLREIEMMATRKLTAVAAFAVALAIAPNARADIISFFLTPNPMSHRRYMRTRPDYPDFASSIGDRQFDEHDYRNGRIHRRRRRQHPRPRCD
jgi:hypothetical protein